MPEANKLTLIETYTALSENNADKCRYSALQHAAYEPDAVAVGVLLEKYEKEGTLSQALSYNQGKFRENILHIAIKDPESLNLCCKALQKENLLETCLLQQDGGGDNVLHQIVEFGRPEALDVLMTYDEFRACLPTLFSQTNTPHGETPLDLANDFEKTKTIQQLIQDEVLTEKELKVSRDNLPAIQAAYADLSQPRTSLGMR